MVETLIALLDGEEMGRIDRTHQHRLGFTYAEAWRSSPRAIPLSLSLPLSTAQHSHERIEAFLWGLLPDNEQTLERWARRFQVSARNVFALLAHVGEDCAGAVQFVTPDRLDRVRAFEPEVKWLEESDVAERLRRLREDHSAWRLPQDSGQFSLAGAQPKTAMLYLGGRWGIPSGRLPTTHILKPPTGELDGYAENEHLCLSLARAMGLSAVSSEVRRFQDEVTIVIKRFDRVFTRTDLAGAGTPPVLRVHQEDVCQALGLHPMRKYQNDGGPDPRAVVDLVRTHSTNPLVDVGTFVDALAFNWLIAGTDAHAKNYALLHGHGGQVRLAPLYDLSSALPYDPWDFFRLKLAMKIGGKYKIRDVGARQWRKLAAELRLDPAAVVHRVTELATLLGEQAPLVRQHVAQQGLTHPIIDPLTERLRNRAQRCRDNLQLLGEEPEAMEGQDD